jgi:predicted ATP-grasp superfamily ATP-dependent carboligase
VRKLVVLDGVAVRGIPKKRRSFCVAEPEKLKDCKEKGVKSAHAGIIHGIAGIILNECLTRKITEAAFLVPAVAFMPDPEGAATLIDTLNRVYDLNVETKVLLKKAEEINRN